MEKFPSPAQFLLVFGLADYSQLRTLLFYPRVSPASSTPMKIGISNLYKGIILCRPQVCTSFIHLAKLFPLKFVIAIRQIDRDTDSDAGLLLVPPLIYNNFIGVLDLLMRLDRVGTNPF